MGNNVGIASLKVELLDKSPFGSQQRQEQANYLVEEILSGLPLKVGIDALPAPISGFRCAEVVSGYDNFLVDNNGIRLEDAKFEQITTTTETGEVETVTSTVHFDSNAVARVREKKQARTEATEAGDEEFAAQDDFFTWQTSDSIFMDAVRPRPFTVPPVVDNSPEWTYAFEPRPGAGNDSYILMPFQRKNPPDSKSPIHWGCKKRTAIAANQGFELTYYYCMRDPAIADRAKSLIPRYNFQVPAGLDEAGEPTFKPIEKFDLTRSVYFAFEFGVGSENNHLLVILANDYVPSIWRINGSDATLLDFFSAANGKTIFDFNHKYLTISVEPVQGALIIRSNAFFDTPWVVLPPSQAVPLFVDKGHLALYGGNLMAGFAFRPLEYLPTARFAFPDMSFNIIESGTGTILPSVSLALKGGGEVEQNRTYGNTGGNPAGKGEPEILMAETEKVTTDGVDSINISNAKTLVEYSAGTLDIHEGLSRNITMSLKEVPRPDDVGPTTNQFGQQIQSTQSGKPQTRFYSLSVVLESSDVPQPDGFVAPNGRSPYIWFVRVEVPGLEAPEPSPVLDISCDVMSVDLTMNAVSEHEVSQTGTVTVLNKNRGAGGSGRDYRTYSNRAVYMRISGGWSVCAVDGMGPAPIFEGLSVNAQVQKRAEREVVVFKVEDYMFVLQSMKFFLCPFYDGMKAMLAVRDMVQMTGLADRRIMTDSKQISQANLSNDLGLSYIKPFESPQYRFPDGTSLKDGILKIAKYIGKMIYFDQNGKFHIDTKPGGTFGDESFHVIGDYYTKGAPNPFFLVWNQVSTGRILRDVYNSVSVVTVDKNDPGIIIALHDSFSDGIRNPNAEGYLGFKKPLVIKDAALGTFAAASSYFDFVRKRVGVPPLTASFEAYGRPGLRPLSVVRLDGQPLKVLNISSKFDAKENQFWQAIEGEWIFAGVKDASRETQPAESGNKAGNGGAGAASTT